MKKRFILTKKERAEIEAMDQFLEENDDMPDGAFFALAEQMYGWTYDDWIWKSEVDPLLNK